MISALFLTARFRSGSTALWNMMRQVPEVLAYYEPLNERLPKLIEARTRPDASHIGVKDYFGEYQAAPDFAKHYRDEFGVHRLSLQAHDRHPLLENYLKYLLGTAQPAKVAVLKCNRIDFRLSWIKTHFPDIPIVHLYRSPRDSWVSTLNHSPVGVNADKDIDIDPYALMTWARDLALDFPFLCSDYIRHPYQRFYYLWKLSLWAGQKFADLSLSFENDVLAQPQSTIVRLLNLAQIDNPQNRDACLAAIVQRPTEIWRSYRSEDWFASLEQECNEVLNRIDREAWLAGRSLAQDPAIAASFPTENVVRWVQRVSQLTILAKENLEASLTAELKQGEINAKSLQNAYAEKIVEVDSLGKNLNIKNTEVQHLQTQLALLIQTNQVERANFQTERDSILDQLHTSAAYAQSLQDARDTLQAQWTADRAALQASLAQAVRYSESLEQTLSQKDQYAASLEAQLRQQPEAFAQQLTALRADLLAAQQYAASLEAARLSSDTYAQSLKEALQTSEAYAQSLTEARRIAEDYARSLETAQHDAEKYIASLKIDHEDQLVSSARDRANLLAELSRATALARSKRHALDVLLGFG